MSDSWRDGYDKWKLQSPYDDRDGDPPYVEVCPCCDSTGWLIEGPGADPWPCPYGCALT